MDLKNTILSIKPSEYSGSVTSSRYDYQKDIAISLLLELHNKSGDYLLVLDYHDDILILNSSIDPTEIQFYQVKSKASGSWSLKNLLKREKDKDGKVLSSILGKLYKNKINFPSNTSSLNFLTNAVIKIEMNDGSSSEHKVKFCMSNLSYECVEKIKNLLLSEHSLSKKPDCEDYLFFHISNLSLSDHSNHTVGKIEAFLQKRNKGSYPTSLIYQSLFDQIKRKTNYDARQINTFEELVNSKSISKSEFEEIIKEFVNTKDKNTMDVWIQIENRLNNENFSVSDIKKLRMNFRKYQIEKTTRNSILDKIEQKIETIIEDLESSSRLDTIRKSLNDILFDYKKNPIKQDLYDDFYIQAIALDLMYDEN